MTVIHPNMEVCATFRTKEPAPELPELRGMAYPEPIVEHSAALHVHRRRDGTATTTRRRSASEALLLQPVDDEGDDLFDALIIGPHCARTVDRARPSRQGKRKLFSPLLPLQ